MAYWQFPKYVSVGERKRKAENKLKKLLKKNPDMKPVRITGRTLAATWWGKAWNANLEKYADYANRIGRGRSYVRHSAVLDLNIKSGRVTSLVQGSASQPYTVVIKIKKVSKQNWRHIKAACDGKLDSLKKLLSGEFPKALGDIFTQKGNGLFPSPNEIEFSCSCPDWAVMCKHVAATLYGVGARLDENPGLFFKLRGVRVADLVSEKVVETSRYILEKAGRKTERVMEDSDLSTLFGIDMDTPDQDPAKGDASSGKHGGKRLKKSASTGIKKSEKETKNRPADDLQTVEKAVLKSRHGITTAGLVENTGLDIARIRYLISRLKKEKKIKTPKRGIYVGVKPAPDRSGRSELEIVADIINNIKTGVTTATLVEKSGMDVGRVRYAISRLKNQEKIKTVGRGIYVPVKPARDKQLSGTGIAIVEKIVINSKEGVTAGILAERTGFDLIKIRNIIYRLKFRGKIKAVSRGVYKKV